MASLVELYLEELRKNPIAFSQVVVGEVYQNILKQKAYFKVHVGAQSWEKEFDNVTQAQVHREAFYQAVRALVEESK